MICGVKHGVEDPLEFTVVPVTWAFGRTQVHRLTTSVEQFQELIQIQDRQAESSQPAEVGNGRADGR